MFGCAIRSTHSTSPVSSQSTVDAEVSKTAVKGGVTDPGFDSPSIDLSLVQTSTPYSGSCLLALFAGRHVDLMQYTSLHSAVQYKKRYKTNTNYKKN